MEVARGDMQFIPMGKIDVSELSSNNGVGSCDCILTELSTGVSNRILLRLKNSQQKLEQSQKVFSFFGSVIGINTDQGKRRIRILKIMMMRWPKIRTLVFQWKLQEVPSRRRKSLSVK